MRVPPRSLLGKLFASAVLVCPAVVVRLGWARCSARARGTAYALTAQHAKGGTMKARICMEEPLGEYLGAVNMGFRAGVPLHRAVASAAAIGIGAR